MSSVKVRRILALLNDPRNRERMLQAMNRENSFQSSVLSLNSKHAYHGFYLKLHFSFGGFLRPFEADFSLSNSMKFTVGNPVDCLPLPVDRRERGVSS